MRTRSRGPCYELCVTERYQMLKRKRIHSPLAVHATIKRRALTADDSSSSCSSPTPLNPFEDLPDDLLSCIFVKIGSSAPCPSHFFNVFLTCKRFKEIGVGREILSQLSTGAMAISVSKWTDKAHRFLKECAEAGNMEACYTLGMIEFYCMERREVGASLMAKAAMASHAGALYSMAIIQFNGSGVSKKDRDLRSGVALCARSAYLGHVDALRELGHCLQDGYGVDKNVVEGRKFLVQANARELACILARSRSHERLLKSHMPDALSMAMRSPLLSDFGWNVPVKLQEAHQANRFMAEWFGVHPPEGGLRLCSHRHCGRPETRRHEFRRCSVCGRVNYCSRACQAMDWKIRHKHTCIPMDLLDDLLIADGDGDGDGDEHSDDDQFVRDMEDWLYQDELNSAAPNNQDKELF